MLEIPIKLFCIKCRKELTGEVSASGARLGIEPCPACLNVVSERSYEEGVNAGEIKAAWRNGGDACFQENEPSP